MAVIHFLNVGLGDCIVIQHDSGRVSVVDVCKATPPEPMIESFTAELAKSDQVGIIGNFQQKRYPVNPISYMKSRGIGSIFRYVQTHPDMDHMDGIKALFDAFPAVNFWDTDNNKELPSASWNNSPYNEEDWRFYKGLRNGTVQNGPKRLTLLSNSRGAFYNAEADGTSGGDGLYILAPTPQLVRLANNTDEYNECSYVLLYVQGENRIVFGGDSHDDTWEYILSEYGRWIANVDLLIAPHHGRQSGRSYDFLNVLRPTLTFFGNARSEHLAYGSWSNRNLRIVTNNQANCMLVNAGQTPMALYVTHENYARRANAFTFWDDTIKAWYVGPVARS